MGAPIARRILQAGHDVRVVDRSVEATRPLVSLGAVAEDTPAAAASGASGVLLSLPGPDEVHEAVAGPDGVLAASDRPTWVVDLSTNSTLAVRRLRELCEEAGVAFIDAPVSGGRVKAEAGTLSVMVGASPAEFELVEPYLRCFGTELFHVGPSGAGTIAKLINNQLFLAAGVLVQEAYLLASAAGLAPSDVHPVLGASSAATYVRLAPMLLRRNFDEVNFRLDIATKDLALAVAVAESSGVELPTTRAALGVYQASMSAGLAAKDFHATLLQLEAESNHEVPPLLRRPGSKP